MIKVGISEAARVLGVSEDTIRRRLRRGELQAERVERPQGYTWLIQLDDAELQARQDPGADTQAAGQEDQEDFVRFLKEQIRIKDAQIGELVHTIREMQARMLPAPVQHTSLWRRIWKRNP